MADNLVIKDYVFTNKKEYDKAKKELDAITYMKANSDFTDPKMVYKIYSRLLDKGTFQTVIGYEFLKELRAMVIQGGIIAEQEVKPIPVRTKNFVPKEEKYSDTASDAREVRKLQALYEKEKNGKLSMKIIIGFLTVIIIGMLAVAQFTPYSVFTNYEDKIVNKYAQWQEELEEKEAELNAREEGLK